MGYQEHEPMWRELIKRKGVVLKETREVLDACDKWTEDILKYDLGNITLDPLTFLIFAQALREAIFRSTFHLEGQEGDGKRLNRSVFEAVNLFFTNERHSMITEIPPRFFGTFDYPLELDSAIIELQMKVSLTARPIAKKYYEYRQLAITRREDIPPLCLSAVENLQPAVENVKTLSSQWLSNLPPDQLTS